MRGHYEYEYLSYRKNQLKNLIALARIDGFVDERELAFIQKVAKKHRLKDKHVQEFLSSEEVHSLSVPSGYEQRLDQLHDLVGLMLADDVIEESEFMFCQIASKEFGFSPEVIDELVNLYNEGAIDYETWREFLEKARKYVIK